MITVSNFNVMPDWCTRVLVLALLGLKIRNTVSQMEHQALKICAAYSANLSCQISYVYNQLKHFFYLQGEQELSCRLHTL